MEDLNNKYWERMTMRSTYSYCQEMLRLSAAPFNKVSEVDFEQKCNEYILKVIEYNREKTLKEHLQELHRISPFPDDICGYLHEYNTDGIFQPLHLMCKIATIRVPGITFEFLVEYGILEPDVEIYYGIKAISDNEDTTEEFAEKIIELSNKWFDYIENYRNLSRGKYAGYYHRHKFTNNVHDGTFWISWVRIESDEQLEKAIEDLKNKVYPTFKKFLLSEKKYKQWLISNVGKDSFNEIFDKLNSTKIQTTKNMKDKREKAEEHPELINELERICSVNDRNSIINKSLFIERYNNYYKFVCDNDLAWIFIQRLFCKNSFERAFKLAITFWSEMDKKENSNPSNSELLFREYVKAEDSSQESDCLTLIATTRIDRRWVKEHFRDKDGSMFKTSFFKQQRVKFHDKKKYLKIKTMLTNNND